MKDNYNKKELMQMIESDFSNLSKEDIKKLIDKELSKETDKVDTDYIDLCFKLMSMNESNDSIKHKGNKVKISKIILIAAAIAILFSSIGLTAYAKANNMKITDVFVQLFSDHATIDYKEKHKTELTEEQIVDSELYKTLLNYGIENIMLPQELYNMPFTVDYENDDFTETYIGIAFEDKTVDATVRMYKDEKYVGNPDVMGDFTASKKIIINGVDVYLFERNSNNPKEVNTSISYMIGLTEYFIDYQGDIENAEQLINQMK